MRILCCITKRNDEILRIMDTLKRMGHTVHALYSEAYRLRCNYFWKKVDECGLHHRRLQYEQHWREKMLDTYTDWHPDVVLFVNVPDVPLPLQDLRVMTRSKFVLWLVDYLHEDKEIPHHLRQFYCSMSRVFTFEKSNVRFLEKAGIQAKYCPVGYSNAYSGKANDELPRYDVVFVGTPYKHRLNLLERVAALGQQKGWRICYAGPLYETRYFWKSIILKYRYPALYRVWHRGRFTPEQVAALYQQARICLNIHTVGAGSLNPRSFEILATGTCEIVDERRDYDKLVPAKDLLVYHDEENLLAQIDYYLQHESERRNIAQHGQRTVSAYYSQDKALTTILAN